MIQTFRVQQNYLPFFRNMNNKAKLEIINWLSNSMLEKKEEETDDFFDCFGAFVSDKTAEQQIEEIRNARYFTDKNFDL